jgi:hypothetical protein
MLKGKGDRDGREMLIFGLSFENLERLKQNKPIMVWREEMGIIYDILIFAGKTEASMADAIRNPDTIVHTVPRRPKN